MIGPVSQGQQEERRSWGLSPGSRCQRLQVGTTTPLPVGSLVPPRTRVAVGIPSDKKVSSRSTLLHGGVLGHSVEEVSATFKRSKEQVWKGSMEGVEVESGLSRPRGQDRVITEGGG